MFDCVFGSLLKRVNDDYVAVCVCVCPTTKQLNCKHLMSVINKECTVDGFQSRKKSMSNKT